MKGVRIGYISATIGNPEDDLHVTLARRYDADETDLINMQNCAEQIKRMLPLTISWGNYCTMGERGTFPAYRVYFVYHQKVVDELYTRFYKEAAGKAMWPRAKFHVTVDTPAKRNALEALIRSSPENQFQIREVSFKTRVEGLVAEQGTPTWSCAICGLANLNINKTCGTEGCDQWAPHAAPRAGDWSCCGVNNFASRTSCMKCNRPRGNLSEYEVSPNAPSAPPAHEISPLKKQATGNKGRPDWRCYKCDFIVFGSKDSCFKCGSKNPHL